MMEWLGLKSDFFTSLAAADIAITALRNDEQLPRRTFLRSAAIEMFDFLRLGSAARAARAFTIRCIRRARKSLKARVLWFWRPLVPPDRFTECCRNAIQVLRARSQGREPGHYLEFGVSRGTSLACMYQALESEHLPHVRLIGFDSFQGLPAEAAEEGWSPGAFWSTRAATEKYLTRNGVDLDRVTLVEGWFQQTLTEETRRRFKIEAASLIMIDCDIYSASRDALWFCEPLICDRAVIFFDDWGRRSEKGEIGQKEAFDEFLAAFPSLAVEPLPGYIPEARVFLVTRRRADSREKDAGCYH
jgi:O-methyltransferase